MIGWGCSGSGLENKEMKKENIITESVNLAECYRDIYEEAVKEGKQDSSELKTDIIDEIAKMGYAVSDMENTVDMCNADQMELFCGKAQKRKKSSATVFSVLEKGGFLRYDFTTEKGKINVILSTLQWKNNDPKVIYYHEFEACAWKYTKNGYFFVEEYQPPGYDGSPAKYAIRVKPLGAMCRKYNCEYVSGVGYKRNNLLITNWDESDYSGLDFYDLYEKFYRMKYGKNVPYEPYEGAEYEIPEEEFSAVIQGYFQISKQQIETYIVWGGKQKTVLYRPRGIHDAEQPYEPYPEVVDYKRQKDGTIRLLVQAVWKQKMTDQAVISELVVRPTRDGSYQYVSNHILSENENSDRTWYKPRLTEKEWDTYYKNKGE